MTRLAALSLGHPKRAVAAWLAIVAGLGFVGSQIQDRFSPSILVVKGTESSRAEQIATSRFGNSVLVPIMLQGPAAQLDRQGPNLVRGLRARADSRVLSPWDRTPGSDALRPKAGVATIVTAVERSEKTVDNTIQPQIERTVKRYVASPVKAYVTGQPSIDRAMRSESISTTRTAVLIALPALFLLCAILFGRPLVAALVVALSGSVLAVGYGLTALTARVMEVDPVAVGGAAIVGLGLSAAFALMVESRYREEIAARHGSLAHSDPGGRVACLTRTCTTAGRTVLLAGAALVVSMILATTLSTTEILNSVGVAAMITTAVAAIAAAVVLPAALLLAGTRLDSLSFRGAGERLATLLPSRVPARLIRHPIAIGGVALLGLVALSAPVLRLHSGPPDPKYLPSGNAARQSYEAVARQMGPGWLTPYEVVVAKPAGTITTREFLKELASYQDRIANDPQVVSVVGPGEIAKNANDLQGVPRGLNTAASTATKSKKDLKKLIAGLGQAGGGVAQLRSGLAAAAGGALLLNSGSGQAASGSTQLRTGLEQALAGAVQLKDGSAAAASGARQLNAGLGTAQSQVAAGLPQLHQLVAGIGSSIAQVSQLATTARGAAADVDSASRALANMTSGRSDPQYQNVAAALARAQASSATVSSGLGKVAPPLSGFGVAGLQLTEKQVRDLYAGLIKLHDGARQLSAGNGQIAGGNSQLAGGLTQLAAGARQLEAGLGQLHGGTGQLASGLSSGVTQSAPLQAGMGEITKAVVHSRNTIPSTADLERLKKQSPRLFDSGYFVLAALEGAPTASRQAAGFTVNLERGGAAGRITVVPRFGATDARTRALGDRLRASAAAFARSSGTEAAVGGNAAALGEYRSVAASKLPAVIGGITLFTFLLLLGVSRSLTIPLVGVALNLVTLGATFGVLTLLFGGGSPVLGGPGFTDPVTIISIATVVLGLSAIYQVFVVARARERYDEGATEDASYYGLNHTWAVVTGASLPMLAAAALFTPALLTVVRELAIGTLVAVLINATIVRLVLLPATIALLGSRMWWLPDWLGRRLPSRRLGHPGPGASPPALPGVRHKPH